MTKKRIDNYSAMVTSKYFESIEDFINLEIAVKRFRGNMERFHFNPIPLTEDTRPLFPNLETFHCYSDEEEIFSDGRISKQYIWYEVDYERFLEEKEYGNDCKCICYTKEDKNKYGKDIPSNVKVLKNEFFEDQESLKSTEIPSSVTKLCGGDIGCAATTSVELPNCVIKLGRRTFQNFHSLELINISDSVNKIGNFCFSDCFSLKSVEIPPTVTKLGEYCFRNCKSLTSIKIPNSVIEMGCGCFKNCSSLKVVEMRPGIKEMNRRCFFNCSSLKSIEIPNTVGKIGDECFYGCKSIETISIPNSVVELGHCCFKYCGKFVPIIPSSVTQFNVGCLCECKLSKYDPQYPEESFKSLQTSSEEE